MRNPGVLDREVKPVDLQKEISLFEKIISSFQILPQNNPALMAEKFIEKQPFSKPVLKSETIHKGNDEALVYVARIDGTCYKVRLVFDKNKNCWQVKSASEMGEDVIEHNQKK